MIFPPPHHDKPHGPSRRPRLEALPRDIYPLPPSPPQVPAPPLNTHPMTAQEFWHYGLALIVVAASVALAFYFANNLIDCEHLLCQRLSL